MQNGYKIYVDIGWSRRSELCNNIKFYKLGVEGQHRGNSYRYKQLCSDTLLQINFNRAWSLEGGKSSGENVVFPN